MATPLPDHASEYNSARRHAALFDVSARSKVELAGLEALMFLHNLCTQDVKNLSVGAGCEAFLTNAKARVVARILVGRFRYRDQDVVWLDCEPGQGQKVLSHLNHFLISEQVELADRTSELGMLHVCGPEAPAVLERVFGEPLPELPPLHHVACRVVDVSYFIRRHDPLGVTGYDVICESRSTADMAGRLVKAGAAVAGAETFELLRVEAGTPEFGKDIDEERFVVEVGRTEQAICYTKGCFLGQEPIVMARDRGHVNRRLVGVKIDGGEPPPRGARLFREGTEIGQVTSSIMSPQLGQPLSLAYVRRGSWDVGTRLQLDPASDGRMATVIDLPVHGDLSSAMFSRPS